MKDLMDIFLQPGPVLARQQERPTGWLPVLIIAATSALFSYMYLSAVDGGWFARESVERSGEELSKAQLDAMATTGDNPVHLWMGVIVSLIASVVFLVLWAVYFLLAGKLTGLAVSFKQGLGLAGWASMPTVLGYLLAIYGTIGMAPQTFISDLMLTSLDPMLMQLPPESPWKAFATSFNFLNLWSIGLAALGWKLWSKDTGWTRSIVVATLPFVLIYGYQVIKALLA